MKAYHPPPAWQAAHEQAAIIPMLYTREAKKRAASELLRMLRQALNPQR